MDNQFSQEILSYMKEEMTRSSYRDSWELAQAAADMFDLWEKSPSHDAGCRATGCNTDKLPEWLISQAEDILFG